MYECTNLFFSWEPGKVVVDALQVLHWEEKQTPQFDAPPRPDRSSRLCRSVKYTDKDTDRSDYRTFFKYSTDFWYSGMPDYLGDKVKIDDDCADNSVDSIYGHVMSPYLEKEQD